MKNISRRQALKTAALAGTALAVLPGTVAQTETTPVAKPVLISTAPELFTLPPLPYAYDALEPFIDAQTMQIHHDKHHAAYVANLNKAIAEFPAMGKEPVEALLMNLNSVVPEKIRTAVRNNGGGHYNHSLFWQMMKKGGGGQPTGELSKAIDASFGNFSSFKEGLTKAALGQFGSGWAWLVLDSKQLKISGTPNQDTPLATGQISLLGVDVWEHAYYLKYQNKRADYVNAWFNVVNWDFVSERYAKSQS
jgi:Fe-Mn family superoxide dismutase